MIKKCFNARCRTKFFVAGLFCLLTTTQVNAASEVAPHGTEKPLRRIISSDNPLFVYSSVYHGAEAERLQRFWDMLPEDVKPYFGVHVNPDKKDSPEIRAWIESVMDVAEKNGIPAIIEVEGFDSNNDTPFDYWSGLFGKYDSLIGINISELAATGVLTGGIMKGDYIDKMIGYMETAAEHGGYFIWQDMGWNWPFPKHGHVFLRAGENKKLYRAIVNNGANIILVHKHNGNGRRMTTDAAVIGFWASGIVSNWGTHSEGWLWWESGYERLFQPSVGHKRSEHVWESVFTFPPSQYGADWLLGAAGGATIFSLEAFFQGYTTCDADMFTPAFRYVVLPLIRQIINHGLIPTRSEVRGKIRAAFHPRKADEYLARGDRLFRGLYGHEESTLLEWMPSTGRYYYIPIIPILADDSIVAGYPFVFDARYYRENFRDVEKKRAFFNDLYPAEGKGDSWFTGFGDRWFIVNPNENRDIDTSFEFELENNPGVKLQGRISAHTHAVVVNEENRIHIYLSNYRFDSDKDVWGNENLANGEFCKFVKGKYTSAPSDEALRGSGIVISGVSPEKIKSDITVAHRGDYEITNDADTVSISVDHNGPVYIDVEIGL